jgi:hypothetical protein
VGRFAIISVALAQVGCAAAVNGFSGGHTTQRVPFVTEPPGATVSSGEDRCVTPCELHLARGSEAVVAIRRDGFDATTVRLRGRPQLATLGNFLLIWPIPLAPVGILVDLGFGTTFELVPARVELALDPQAVVTLASLTLPAAPSPRAETARVEPSPMPPMRLGVRAVAGYISTPGMRDGMMIAYGIVGTWRPARWWSIGAAYEQGSGVELSFFGSVPPKEDHWLASLLAGAEYCGRYGKLSLHGAMGWHAVEQHSPTSGDAALGLPFVGLRSEAAFVFADAVSFGLWLMLSRHLGTATSAAGPVGDRFGGGGLSLGFVGW